MRHRNFGKKLGRNHNQRKALFKNLALSLFTYGAIETTEARVKAVRPLVEKMCRLALVGDLSARRELFTYFQNQATVNLLCSRMTDVFAGHQNSFVTTQKITRRQGDDALIIKISLVKPFNLKLEKTVDKKETKKETVKKVVASKPKAKAKPNTK